MEELTYDSFSFVANGCVLTNVDYMILAQRLNQLEKLANRPGSVLVQSQYGTKPVTIEGYYVGVGETNEQRLVDAQTMYDVLAAALNRQERPLIIPHAGGTVRFIATPQNLVIKNPDGLNKLTFSFEFVVPRGHSVETESTVLVDTVVTSASSSIPLNVLGSVTARPLTTLTFTSVTGGIGKTVTLRNARDFIGLTFARDFLTGDVITIDSERFQIYVNGVFTKPTGRMPTWANGTGAMYYSDTFTNREVHIESIYNVKKL